MIRADLHIHTYYSDGGQSPSDVVAAAKRKGVNLISVTDHDNANGSAEVRAIAEGNGVTAVDGVEISAYDGDVKVHLLAYNLDSSRPLYAQFFKKINDGAEERTRDILAKLSSHGVNISYEEVLRERRCPRSPVHAMYIAAAGAKKGYARTAVDFYVNYLNYGRIGFSCIRRPQPEETVRFVKECGGICSLAHPARISLDEDGVNSLIKRLVDCGLDGIEAVYSGHTVRETQYYKGIAEKYGLLVTGGSDTHYGYGNRSVGEPAFYPDDRLLSALKLI